MGKDKRRGTRGRQVPRRMMLEKCTVPPSPGWATLRRAWRCGLFPGL